MVRLIDDQQVQGGQLVQIRLSREGLHHSEGGVAIPGFLVGVEHRRFEARVNALELAAVLAC